MALYCDARRRRTQRKRAVLVFHHHSATPDSLNVRFLRVSDDVIYLGTVLALSHLLQRKHERESVQGAQRKQD